MSTAQTFSMLDYVFTTLSSRTTQLDFAIVLRFSRSLNLADLNLGASSARKLFPTTSSIVYRNRWEYLEVECSIEYVSLFDSHLVEAAIRNFLTKQFDLRVHHPYSQLLISVGQKDSILVSRFHHAAADGLSAAMWLAHQLNVAFGNVRPTEKVERSCEPTLKTQQKSVRRSKFGYEHASESLCGSQETRTGVRRWTTFEFNSNELRANCRRAGGFTYNDLLSTCALETFVKWNNRHQRSTEVGLWFPVNIRFGRFNGFGNGTSRIRLYPRYDKHAQLSEKARAIRGQIKWCTSHGEWVIPNVPWLQSVPRWITRPAMNSYLNSSSVDMATGVFTHVDSRSIEFGEVFQHVDRIECVGLLHPRQAVAINGTTHRGITSLTLTYDSGQLTSSDAEELSNLFKEQIAIAVEQL